MSRSTQLWVYPLVGLVTGLGLAALSSAPIRIAAPCTIARAAVLSIEARIDGECAVVWPNGLFGPRQLDVRPVGLRIGR